MSCDRRRCPSATAIAEYSAVDAVPEPLLAMKGMITARTRVCCFFHSFSSVQCVLLVGAACNIAPGRNVCSHGLLLSASSSSRPNYKDDADHQSCCFQSRQGRRARRQPALLFGSTHARRTGPSAEAYRKTKVSLPMENITLHISSMATVFVPIIANNTTERTGLQLVQPHDIDNGCKKPRLQLWARETNWNKSSKTRSSSKAAPPSPRANSNSISSHA